MDSDILFDPQAILAVAQQSEPALALNRHELGEEEMKVVVDADMRITEISKTCRPEDALGESVGIEKMTADYSEALGSEHYPFLQLRARHARGFPTRHRADAQGTAIKEETRKRYDQDTCHTSRPFKRTGRAHRLHAQRHGA